MFITFCDSGSQVAREAVEIAENWESYHKRGAVIGDFAPSVCSGWVIYSSARGNLAGNY